MPLHVTREMTFLCELFAALVTVVGLFFNSIDNIIFVFSYGLVSRCSNGRLNRSWCWCPYRLVGVTIVHRSSLDEGLGPRNHRVIDPMIFAWIGNV